MKLLASLDRRDRRLLLVTGALVLCTVVLLVLVRPQAQPDNYIPSTYSTAPHGAKAAYLLLARLGYTVERSEGSLVSLANAANSQTVLILAEPTRAPTEQESAAVRRVLEQGGRVLAAGFLSAAALPDENLDDQSPPPQLIGGLCEAEPVGFTSLAGGGKVVLHDIRAVWRLNRPAQRAAYMCAGEGVVVTYAVGKGTVVWWASATPLENRYIGDRGSLDLLFNSLQLRHGNRIVWDESLHAAAAAPWNPAQDRILLALLVQLSLAGLLLVLSRGRRSGPLRPMPSVPRASPLEFIRSLGGLYRSSGANHLPVTIAYQRFRSSLRQRYGIAGAQTAAASTLAATLAQLLGIDTPSLRSDLEACEQAGTLTDLSPRQALALVKALAHYTDLLVRQASVRPAKDTYSEHDRGTIEPVADSGSESKLRRSA